ncbi:MAG: TfoX/Sxy family protein [Mesorhizobium sp.]
MTTDIRDHVRLALEGDPNISEIRMFGGLCFMLSGNMLVCTMKDGAMLARVGGAQMQSALEVEGVARMVMGGREMKDFVVIAADRLDEQSVRQWIALATNYVGPMPPKEPKAKTRSKSAGA